METPGDSLGWKNQRSKMRFLTFTSSILFIMVLCFLAFCIAVILHQKKATDTNCLTSTCVKTAAEIIKNINPDVKPCENFYEFACGGFLQNAEIPDQSSTISSYSMIEDNIQKQIHQMLEKPNNSDDINAFRLMKTFYSTCMDKKNIEEINLKPIQTIINELGGWPLINKTKMNWINVTYGINQIGYTTNDLLKLSVDYDCKNSTRRVLQISQPLFNVITQETLIKGTNDTVVKVYFEYMLDIATLLGVNRTTSFETLGDCLNFEIQLAKIALTNDELHGTTCEVEDSIEIKNLQTKYNITSWLEYFNIMLSPTVQLTETDVVNVATPNYFDSLKKLLEDTSQRTIINYLIWKMIDKSIPQLTDDMINRQTKFQKFTNGIEDKLPRWKKCVEETTNNLNIVVDAAYSRQYLSEVDKQEVTRMVVDIKKSLTDVIKSAAWMDPDTKRKALKKVDEMNYFVSFPKMYKNDDFLEKYYEGFHLRTDDYLNAMLSVHRFNKRKQLDLLKSPSDRAEFDTTRPITATNAQYSPNRNSITIFGGIMSGVYFNQKRPNYLNYGGIGVVIGHEITHGFDYTGKKFDEKGNFKNWWDEETEQKYLNRSQCLINQYNHYTIPRINKTVNGFNTQGENIADNGGAMIAYLAYEKWLTQNKEEYTLPGLPYSTKQLFWINFGQAFCTKTRDEFQENSVTLDPHSPGRFRIIGTVSNNKYFSADFNCSAESKMNRKEKCLVW